jgi:hypothetical protein
MFETATIDLASPLPVDTIGATSGEPYVMVDPIAFTLFDGVNTITQSSATTAPDFLFATDANGNIVDWLVYERDRSPSGNDTEGWFSCY